ncbi:MAG: GNAT family N-acetyltransferase [Eubacteriales bacterium]|nr:GNAT family N-acetyltransferase [Lachnospiraceae bacterium]MDO4417309.1 GNAT family N-acetyltransferase [Eubacteriales bacterium]
MTIRRAIEKDMDRILALLTQVLEIHADARPDIFIHGTTKYTREELRQVLQDDSTPVYVAVDEADTVMGYVFCVFKEQPLSSNMVPFSSVYIDDLCVDEHFRGQQIAAQLFAYVKELARSRGCYEVTLNVWRGNDGARSFYEKMGMQEMKTMMEYIL